MPRALARYLLIRPVAMPAMRESLDALLPAEMAMRAERIGAEKASQDAVTTFTLAVLGGAFIAFGAAFSTTVATGSGALPFGVARLLTGAAFSLGLILVVVGGAELFTGNNLIVMAWAGGGVSTARLLRNWAIVYFGNFAGAAGVAILMILGRQYEFSNGALGAAAIQTAHVKSTLGGRRVGCSLQRDGVPGHLAQLLGADHRGPDPVGDGARDSLRRHGL